MEGAATSLQLQDPAGHIHPHSQGSWQLQQHLPRLESCSSPALWRPWTLRARDGETTENQQTSELDGQLINCRSKGALGFQHPVRLYLPKSKSQKFLTNMGEKVLASFPVQATIHFYNDDDDANSEEEEEEMSSA
ncbi:protein ripply3 [Neopelma chrysocephalum]|uniref:protein ripply3 n=1 Tax=Neopelma chrysocephalum TaxID=114329 RepID=UPI000FCD45AE|nr:protein ripply3 [Neopelma chrysocephalum]